MIRVSMLGPLMRGYFFVGVLCTSAFCHAQAVPVTLEKSDDGWRLLRANVPYFIRGAGGTASLKELAAAGANSLRTWGGDDQTDILDRAHAQGLTVTVGIWLGHERHGFDYTDAAQVAAQLERARDIVLKHKDHPALLLWGVGNEMEGFAEGDNPLIWKAVNDVAAMIKSLDPNHPTMAVTAEIGGSRIAALQRNCPAIDIHGINSYGGAASLLKRYRDQQPTKPYVLTEFGPAGSWEVAKTDWGAPLEPTSTQKAAAYKRHYQRAVLDAPGLALGSYAFTWGYKMEATATWFGLLLPDGTQLGAVDTLHTLWTGQPPKNRAPVVAPLHILGDPLVKPGQRIRVSTEASDPDGDPLRAHWALRHESTEHFTGGDARAMPADLDVFIESKNIAEAQFEVPKHPGNYRLYYYVYDDAGAAATANVPLKVKGEARIGLPFYVYNDGLEGMPWAPSGWMGMHEALTLNGDHTDNPHSGSASLQMRYAGSGGWVGVAWQNPPNNWGTQDGGIDLRGARYLEFFARGAYGGERIKYGMGLLGAAVAHPDSAVKPLKDATLTAEWVRYRIPLKRLDLSSIKTGFVLHIIGRSSPVTVYLDSIRYVR